MFSACHDALTGTLGRHFGLSKSRLQTLAVLILGLAQSRTVNLTHLACHLPGHATHASGYRRLQRFFQFVRLETDRMALLVVHMLDLGRSKCLVLDRTNWKIGASDVNILMLAIVTRRFRVPLLWSLIDHQGSSNTDQRIALVRRYLALFPASSIELLLGDREFIGARWMDFLNENNIPFAVRVKEDMTVTLLDGKTWSIKTLMRRKRARGAPATWQGRLNGTHDATTQPLGFAAKRLPGGELLIVATNRPNPKQALSDYRRRWGIECLFGDAKTRGLNLEDTRLRAAAKLDCMLVVVTLAITWAYRCATCSMGMKAIRRKTHGRREKSWFRVGLDALRRWIINDQQRAIAAWIERAPKRPIRTPQAC
jgi:Transposase DDE domain